MRRRFGAVWGGQTTIYRTRRTRVTRPGCIRSLWRQWRLMREHACALGYRMIAATAQHRLGWRTLGAHARPPGTGGSTPLYLLWRCEGRQRAAGRGAAACGRCSPTRHSQQAPRPAMESSRAALDSCARWNTGFWAGVPSACRFLISLQSWSAEIPLQSQTFYSYMQIFCVA